MPVWCVMDKFSDTGLPSFPITILYYLLSEYLNPNLHEPPSPMSCNRRGRHETLTWGLRVERSTTMAPFAGGLLSCPFDDVKVPSSIASGVEWPGVFLSDGFTAYEIFDNAYLSMSQYKTHAQWRKIPKAKTRFLIAVEIAGARATPRFGRGLV